MKLRKDNDDRPHLSGLTQEKKGIWPEKEEALNPTVQVGITRSFLGFLPKEGVHTKDRLDSLQA